MTDLLTKNKTRWAACKVNPSKLPLFNSVVNRLNNPTAVARYKAVEAKTKVPWWFIAVAHEREASQRWDRSLAQGDPWNKRSIHVPAGRGPFTSWEDAAVDALVNCAPFAAKNKDWSAAGALTLLEKYNGLGYSQRGLPSPYIWAGTDQYTKGKYVADGVFNPNTVDSQLGCAGLLKQMKVFSTSSVTGKQVATGGGIVAVAMATMGAAWQFGASHWPWFLAAGFSAGFFALLYSYLKQGNENVQP